MHKAVIRSTIFNVAFYVVTTLLAVLYIPALFLPREMFVALVRFWLRIVAFLEYLILGLTYEVQGKENIPKQGAYIIAAKHQSAYETLKLHILFHDPAIILKKELLRIPLFGAYLKKAGMLAIDRSTPEKALRSIQEGALRIKEEGRPIVIFPQGTRVGIMTTAEDKPYKPGVARIQEVTGLPVVPLALNSGLFWGRNAWSKSPGTVTFSIMNPIPPGKDRQALMSELEEKIEGESNVLIAQARKPRHAQARKKEVFRNIIIGFALAAACGFYMVWWKMAAETIRNEYIKAFPPYASVIPPQITGFPFAMKIHSPQETIGRPEGNMVIYDVTIQGFPLPLAPIYMTTGKITVSSYKWASPLAFDGLDARVRYWNGVVTITDSLLKKDTFQAALTGTVDLKQKPFPQPDLTVSFTNHYEFLLALASQGILDERTALFMSAGFGALADAEGVVKLPVTQKGRTLYAGPLAFAELPMPRETFITADPPSAGTDSLQAPSP